MNVQAGFFFHPFRDDALTSREEREQIWSAKIKDFKSRIAQPATTKRAKTQSEKHSIKVLERTNFKNELAGLFASYAQDPQI